MKLSNLFLLVSGLLLWIVPCSAGNIAYYDSQGNQVTKERYYEVCRQRTHPSNVNLSKSIVPEKNDVNEVELREQLQAFLRIYCRTFEEKNLSKFTGFFTDDALERGRSFNSLLPKYRKYFDILESIDYRIELTEYIRQGDTGTLELQGKFNIKWLQNGSGWQKNSGWISMRLVEDDNSYRIKHLDYN